MSWRELSPDMQRAVWDFGWPRLWPVQEEAIDALLHGGGNVLVTGDTASGKTEAAFLPILSLPAASAGFTVLYVSPLRALLNDQYQRLQALGAYCGVTVHLWHSDVARTRKRRTEEAPSGILLTTPESIEALCIHRAQFLPLFFGELRFVVIDELHAFLGTERGMQLRSLLSRLERCCATPPRRVGLSATVGDPARAAEFLGPPCTECSGAGPSKGLKLRATYAPAGDPQVLADLRGVLRGRKAIVFCNARARVEALTHALGSASHLPHHGSLHARERAHAEYTLRSADAGAVICTSTLELGIDLGGVDLIAQVNCTHHVASLRQRLGRSGRAPGADRVGQLYATDEAELLQVVAVVELLRQGWVEPQDVDGPWHDVAWHQALSSAVERGFLDEAAAGSLPEGLLARMLADGHLVARGGRYEPGAAGLTLAQRRDFCAVFAASDDYEVAAGPRILGRLPPLAVYRSGTPLILAGLLWTVDEVDHRRRRIEVVPGAAAHPPVFTSHPGKVHGRVREEMAAVLLRDDVPPYLDDAGRQALAGLRRHFRRHGLSPNRSPCLVSETGTELLAFAGDRVASTLALMLQWESGLVWEVTPFGGLFTPEPWPHVPEALWRYVEGALQPRDIEERLMRLVPDSALSLPKFGRILPVPLQRELHAGRELDAAGTLVHLRRRKPA